MRLFDRKAGAEATVFAEAQALLDDGMAFDDVLDLFSAEASWLEPLLRTTTGMRQAVAAEQPSYYFEASLKQKFLAAARREDRTAPLPVLPAPSRAPISPRTGLRTAFAGSAVAGVAAAIGALTLGFVTSDDAVPGDWNYAFKLANERLEYSLSRGDQRIDVQLGQTEARVRELQVLSSSGAVSPADIQRLQDDARELEKLARSNQLDEIQRGRIEVITGSSVKVLEGVAQKQPDLQPAVVTTITTVNDTAMAAGVGGAATVEPLPALTPAPTATPKPDSDTSSSTAGTATPAPGTATASPTSTPSPTATATAHDSDTSSTVTVTPPPPSSTPAP